MSFPTDMLQYLRKCHMGIWCFLKLVIVYVLRYDFLDTFRLRVYKSKKSSFERKIQAGKPGFFFVLFYHLSSMSRHLIKNRLNSIIKLRNLSIFELRFSVKSVRKNNALPSDFFDKVLQSYGINNFTDFG